MRGTTVETIKCGAGFHIKVEPPEKEGAYEFPLIIGVEEEGKERVYPGSWGDYICYDTPQTVLPQCVRCQDDPGRPCDFDGNEQVFTLSDAPTAPDQG
jgi:hypothetical protein